MTAPAPLPAHKKNPIRLLEQRDSEEKAKGAASWIAFMSILTTAFNPERTKASFILNLGPDRYRVTFTKEKT